MASGSVLAEHFCGIFYCIYWWFWLWCRCWPHQRGDNCFRGPDMRLWWQEDRTTSTFWGIGVMSQPDVLHQSDLCSGPNLRLNKSGISIKYHRALITWHVRLNAHLLLLMETWLESMKLCVCLFLCRDGAHRGCSLCAKWTFGWWQLSTLSLSLQWAVLDSNTKNTPWVDGNSSISDVCGYLVANYFQQLLEMQLNKTGCILTPVRCDGRKKWLLEEHLNVIFPININTLFSWKWISDSRTLK